MPGPGDHLQLRIRDQLRQHLQFGDRGDRVMIGFIIVQSLTDVVGHGATDDKTLGALFDRFPDAAILDQRLLWIFVLTYLVVKGAGALSVDALLRRRMEPAIA